MRDAFRDEDDSVQTLLVVSDSNTREAANQAKFEGLVAMDAAQPHVAVPPEESGSLGLSGLAPRFTPFVDRIARQPTWTRDELDRVARELGLMLGGAIDIINEWADEHFGDLLLIEEGDSFLVQGELLIDVSRTT